MKLEERIIIREKPNFYLEAVNLLEEYFINKEQKQGQEAWEEAWQRKSLVDNPDSFSLASLEIDARFSDVYNYYANCKRDLIRVAGNLGVLGPYFALRVVDHEKDMSGFLKRALIMNDLESAKQLSRDGFVTSCLAGLYDLAGLGADYDLEAPESQDWCDKVTHPDFDMGELFKVIGQMPISDSDQLLLLRYFQDIDTYYDLIKNCLLELEQICSKHYPLVKARYEEKIKQLNSEGGLDFYLDLFGQLLISADGFRSGDKVYMVLGIVSYGSMSIRFSAWRRLRLLMGVGLLFSELNQLKDRSKYRDKMAKKQLKAISDPTRYEIIRQLSIRPQYVQELADALGLTAATLSHHLAILQQAMLVGVRIEGRRSYYSINEEELKQLAEVLENMASRSRTEE